MWFGVLFAMLAVTLAQKNIDVDAVIKNKRLLNAYFNCIMDRGSCPLEGVQMKKKFPEAIRTGCANCNGRQKEQMKKIRMFYLKNYRDSFFEMKAKLYPEAKYWDDNIKSVPDT